MSSSKFSENSRKRLASNESVCRRDFLNSTLLASGSLLLSSATPSQLMREDWDGYGGVGDYSHSNGNTAQVMSAGHRIRDHAFDELPQNVTDTGEVYDCVVVGAGLSGLAAALFFNRRVGPGKTCLVIDNHAVFGGEAKRNEFNVDGQRLLAQQGSAYFPTPYPHSFIARFYESIGVDWRKFEYQTWGGSSPEIPVGRTPYHMLDLEPSSYGFYFGAKFGQKEGMWLIDPWGKNLEGAPIPETTRADLLRWRKGHPEIRNTLRPEFPGDVTSRYLDTITLEDYMVQRLGISRETIRNFLSPVTSGGHGIGPDALSGYCSHAASSLHVLDGSDETGNLMFADGNAGLARHMVKTLVPDAIGGPLTLQDVSWERIHFSMLDRPDQPTRIRLNSTVVWVKHDDDPRKSRFVDLVYTCGANTYKVRARSVVMAGGSWTTKHIVKDLPGKHRDAYQQFYRAPCLIANIALRNWRFLYKMGISGCRWFEGLGNYTEVRKVPLFDTHSPTIGPDSPVVITVKVLYSYPGLPTKEQGDRGRAELLGTSFRSYEQRLRQQFDHMFAATGFDAARDIAGIILNRWGHAYLTPQPGFFFGKDGTPAARDILRAGPFGRISFANTDLTGVMDHRPAIQEADRAVDQVLDQVLAD